MKSVNLRLPDDEHARMVAAAKAERRSLGQFVRNLFAEHEIRQAGLDRSRMVYRDKDGVIQHRKPITFGALS
jgi:uncharacterized protein (DUF1778 family)